MFGKFCACGCGLTVSDRNGSKWRRGHNTKVGSPLERFLAKICIKPNGCWEWLGGHAKAGYALLDIESDGSWKPVAAHRFSYETFVGPIPDGKELDHLCRNRGCVNPDHLEPVIHKVNVRRGLAGISTGEQMKARTHCPKGHPYDEQNTRYRKNGRRRCLACRRAEYQKWLSKPGNRDKKNETLRNKRHSEERP